MAAANMWYEIRLPSVVRSISPIRWTNPLPISANNRK